MNIKIQPITNNLVESFHGCLDTVAREKQYLAQIEAVPLEQMRQFVADAMAADISQFVAVDNHRVIGWCDIFPQWAYAIRHRGMLGMGVLAPYRGRGIGKNLLAACIEKAKKSGITRVELEVRIDNENAIRLYERVGFVRDGYKKNGIRIDDVYIDMITMSLILDSKK